MDKYCMIQKGNINMKKYLSLLLALCLAQIGRAHV